HRDLRRGPGDAQRLRGGDRGVHEPRAGGWVPRRRRAVGSVLVGGGAVRGAGRLRAVHVGQRSRDPGHAPALPTAGPADAAPRGAEAARGGGGQGAGEAGRRALAERRGDARGVAAVRGGALLKRRTVRLSLLFLVAA